MSESSGPGVVDPKASKSQARPTSIPFSDENVAKVAFGGPRRSAESLLADLGLTDPRPVLLVIGGADTLDKAIEPQLERLLERGAIRAADEVGATVLDGGTNSGVMAALGRASAASDANVALVGVAPAGKVTFPGDDRNIEGDPTQLEPNHTHLILANSSEWGGETSLLFDVLDILSVGQPSAAILVGGGQNALDEARLAAHRGIPIVVLTGTGGNADALAARVTAPPAKPPDDILAEVIAEADVTFLPLTADPVDLERVLTRFLRLDETLAEAWRQQKLVSAAATGQQGDFKFGQSALLLLGLLVTYLVVAKSVLDNAGMLERYPVVGTVLYFVILLIPITVAVLAAASSRMRPGGRWVLLRGTSESLKREIFRYRARAGIYSHDETRKTSREVKLAEAVGSAMGALMRTDVNLLALEQRAKAKKKPKPKAKGRRARAARRQTSRPIDPDRLHHPPDRFPGRLVSRQDH